MRYENYTVRQGDTLRLIAQRLYGDASRWRLLADLNGLRDPFVSDDPVDQYGPIIGSGVLPAGGIAKGAISVDLSTQLVTCPASAMRPEGVLVLRWPNPTADQNHDALRIHTFYQSDFNEQVDGSTVRFWPASTLRFRTDSVISPTEAPATSAVAGGALSSRSYSVRATYVTVAGGGSPGGTQGAGETTLGPAVTQAIGASQLLRVTAPATFPTGVTGYRVYAGTSDGNETLQATISTAGATWTEPTTGLVVGATSPLTNTAQVGAPTAHPAGAVFTVHGNPDGLRSRVLKTGSLLRAPAGASGDSSLIGTLASDEFTDALGTDLAMDEDGHLSLSGGRGEGGDLLLVSGMANLSQAITNRLATTVGRLPMHPGYGNPLLGLLGTRYHADFLAVVRALASDVILSDGRIGAIEELNVGFDGEGRVSVQGAISVANGSALLALPSIAWGG